MRLPASVTRMRHNVVTSLSLALVTMGSHKFVSASFEQTCGVWDEEGWPVHMRHHVQLCHIVPENITVNTYDWDPWTDPPDCIESFSGSHTFCIYNSSTFANGRGISLFTTSSVAEHIVQNSAAFTDPSVLDGVNSDLNPPFYAQSLPGRGIGLIANRTLQRGDRVFSYTPVVIVDRAAFTELAPDERFFYQRRAVDRLPKHTRESVFALHGHSGGDIVDDIIRTNSFQVTLTNGEDLHNIVLPEISRLNHDCRPNAHYYFDKDTLTHYVHAIHTIYAGEEITISYTDPAAVRDTRRVALKHSWGFDCTCSLCSQHEVYARESDARLALIAELDARLEDWTDTSIATPEMAETCLSLYKQERLHGPIANAYGRAALAYNAVGQTHPTVMYAALAVEAAMLNFGPTDPEVAALRQLMQDPHSHWSWNLRLPKST